jgi:hypothetical protein
MGFLKGTGMSNLFRQTGGLFASFYPAFSNILSIRSDVYSFFNRCTTAHFRAFNNLLNAIKFLVYRGVDPKVAENRQRDLNTFISGLSLNPPPAPSTPQRKRTIPASPTISSVSSPARSSSGITPSRLRSQAGLSASQAENNDYEDSPAQQTRPTCTREKKRERKKAPAATMGASGSNKHGGDNADYEYSAERKAFHLLHLSLTHRKF